MRPSDLAREHGISTQAVRNYERDGFIPPAERTRSGYRIYTAVHTAALRAYLSLIPAYGHSAGGQIMNALHDDELDDALMIIDRGHSQLLRDRDTLDAVGKAMDHLTGSDAAPDPSADPDTRTIGELAHQLRLTPATLRNWEGAGILAPSRDPATGYRVFRANDIRDAELAHLLRRGGYPLDHISTVVQQIRTAGGTDRLSSALDDWQRKLTAQGLAMLNSATQLSHYLTLLNQAAPQQLAVTPPSR
ncbi:TioE family transcriptional regulator [Streptomyces halobius]|uniref:TioE family transcriptional regulator n=1 Tax=Streptomyces halobius TaxID=2879846 RepID=A0ABY4M6P9_9ACTN|nr:TioE family transcriptional regulator [Streptomyces halobius]UQA91916.1 TioE family transcriptional regulator [Streptomyces halobius]